MERITRFRMQLIILLVAMVIGFYAIKLYDLQIVQTGGKQADNMTTFTTITRVKAARGDILDRNGNVLVGNRASYDLVINHFVLLSAANTNRYIQQMTQVCKEQKLAYNDHFPMTMTRPFTYTLEQYNSEYRSYFQSYLAEMDLDSDITAPLLIQTLRRYYSIPDDWDDEQARAVIGVRYEMTLRGIVMSLPNYVFMDDASDDARSAILELNVPGLSVEPSVERDYKTKYAAHILGSVGKMSPEQWEELKNVDGYEMDAEVGQSGLELYLEQYLHGVDGWRVDVVSVDGTVIESYYETVPKAGNNVEVTIDLALQAAAEDSLEDRIKSLLNGKPGSDGLDAEGAAAVAIDPRTGAVLACASYPTYDLSTYSENWEQILAIPHNALYNRALDATYPPGSTFKMCMVVASINSGTITSGTPIEDKGVFDKYKPTLEVFCLDYAAGYGSHGTITAAQALQYSCNYFFYVLGDITPLEAMDATAKGFGLGEPTGVELPENIGHRTNEQTKAELYGEDAVFVQGDKVLAAIGQADDAFSPMQLCVYVSTLANHGTRYKATFLNRVVSADYRELVLENSPRVMSTMNISDDAYQAYVEGMRLVTSEPGGTAYSVFSDFPVSVAGKTGTAQTGATTGSDNGAFVCFAPIEQPEIAIAVYGEKAGHGSSMAVVAKSMLSAYFSTGKVSEALANENTPI